MRSEDLHALIAVAEIGSITGAAQHLNCAQPTLSRRLQRLEADLGTHLLQRHASGARLTMAGQRVHEFAAEQLAAEDALRTELRDGSTGLHGVVRVIASTIPGDFLAPRLIADFSAAHPTVRIEVEIADSAAVSEAVLDRRVDVGFAGRANPHERLIHTPVARDEIVLAVPATHHLADLGVIELPSLSGARFVWREDGSGTQRSFMEALARAGLSLPPGSSSARLGSTQAVISAVEAGLGVGVVSSRALSAQARSNVMPLRLKGLPLHRQLWMVHERDEHQMDAASAFVAVVTRSVAARE